jgi:hypothetical protein
LSIGATTLGEQFALFNQCENPFALKRQLAITQLAFVETKKCLDKLLLELQSHV